MTTDRDRLVERLARVDPVVLLPPRRIDPPPREALTFRDALRLDEGLVLGLYAEGGGYLAAPLVIVEGVPVRRAEPGDGFFERIVDRLARGHVEGRFTCSPIGAVPTCTGERPIDVDQSNESVVVGDRVVVKLYPRTAAGPQPGLDLPAHLASVGFTAIPAPFGSVSWQGDDGGPVLIATVADFLPGATDGWDWYLDVLLAWLRGEVDDEGTFAPAASVGRLAGELHAALASSSNILPHPVRTADRPVIDGWRRRAEDSLDRALDLTEGDVGDRLRSREGRVRSSFATIDDVASAATMRIHGDLHVGQFLRWEGGLAVTDFDGNPLAPVDQRVALEPPVLDVAALVRSLDHLGRIAQRRGAGSIDTIERWIARSRDDLLQAYLAVLGDRGARSLHEPRLLFPFEVAQECHEFAYAARYLPSWIDVPDLAVRSMFP